MFSSNSVKTHNWKESGKSKKGKMAAFRHKLDFPCYRKFAEDLENPGVLFSVLPKGKKQKSVSSHPGT
jgi:hypothetical protein